MELIDEHPPEKVYEEMVGERRLIAVLSEDERGAPTLTVAGDEPTIHEACRIRDELGPEVPWDQVHPLPHSAGWFFQREPWWQS